MDRPWTSADHLANLLATWRNRWAGRDLFRVTAGPHWIRLHLVGEDRDGLVLTSVPGAAVVFSWQGPLPDPLFQALDFSRGHPLSHPLSQLLNSATIEDIGALPGDRVAAFTLRKPDGTRVYLLHQLFGVRTNSCLLDEQHRVLWARHRPPHQLLTKIPPKATWSCGDVVQDSSGPIACNQLSSVLARDLINRTQTTLGKLDGAAKRLVTNLTTDLNQADRGAEFREMAEAVAANLHTLKQGQTSVTLASLNDGRPLTVDMDPAQTPAANMEALFKKARKADKGRQIIADRHARACADAAALENALTNLAEQTSRDATSLDQLAMIQAWRTDHADLLPSPTDEKRRPRGHAPEQPARPFRRYLLEGKWEVWVGRNNKENDELTHRASHVKDIWLHAQGVAGSHVILRTSGKPEQVPKAIIVKAAALAALNSKGRNSALVPVIYTERRYVRKPRKTLAGTAVCLQEKNVFVEPAIPAGAEPI